MVEWRKSSHSGGVDDQACVEVANLALARTGVRDSKNPAGGSLHLTGGAFAALVSEIKTGRHDR